MATTIRTLRPIESHGCSFPTPGTLAAVPDTAASSLIAAGLAEALESEVSTSLYTAHSVLVATADNSPAPVTLAEGTLLGRAAGGDVAALTAAQAGLPTLENYRKRWLQPTSGLDIIPRDVATSSGPVSLGYLRLTTFFTLSSITFTNITMASAATAAGATPTLCRMGIYTSANDGSTWTLVAATANDTDLFAAANTLYTRALDTGGGLPASYTCTAGTMYALGVLVVSAAAAPTLTSATTSTVSSGIFNLSPPASLYKGPQTDLPASVSSPSATARRFWGRLS